MVDPELIENEDGHSCDEDQGTKDEAEYPTFIDHTQGNLMSTVVVTWSHPAGHVLPHNIDHAACHQVVLDVEGVKDLKAFPEDKAGCTCSAFTQG